MPIPQLTSEGFLPPGIHDATLQELEDRFGRFQGSDKRPELFRSLAAFVREVRTWGNAEEILVDGSFVSAETRPSDIDLILVYRADFDFSAPVRPAEYNLLSRRRARRAYGFDVIPVLANSATRDQWIAYFSEDPRCGCTAKGLVRIRP